MSMAGRYQERGELDIVPRMGDAIVMARDGRRPPVRAIVCRKLVVFVALFAAATTARAQSARVWSYDELDWKADKTFPSVQSVLLWGDPATGEHAMLRKFPAGFAPPPHRHPATERVVVVSGTLTVRYADSREKRLGPGSYSEIPAGMEHAVKCLDDAPCVFVLASPGAFAILPGAPATSNPVELLLTSAATDFHAHPPRPTAFRKVQSGFITATDGTRQYRLCGEFRASGKAEWVPFATLQTSGYEQWLGGQAAGFCDRASIKWDDGDLSSALQSRLDSLR